MRPVETLLTFCNLLAFLILVSAPLQMALWAGYSVLIALLIAGLQALVEGPRWQLIPAYILTGLFILFWLLQKIVPAGLVIGLGIFGLTVSIVLPLAVPVFHFPKPTGQYAIGTLIYHWVDADRPDIFKNDPVGHRELMVQIWYPAMGNRPARHAPYLQNGRLLAPAAGLLGLPSFVFTHLKYVTTHAIPSAPVVKGEHPYPVLLFSHGRAGFRTHNTLLVEELVSHGYIVATIDHPYAASGVIFPDGRVAAFDARMYDPEHVGHPAFLDEAIPFLAQDAVFTLDRLTALNQADPSSILTGRLDLGKVGMFGVSLGGAIAAEACYLEPRFRACLAMDVFMPADVARAGLRQPLMLMSRDAQYMQLEGWAQADIDETQDTMRAVFDSLPGAGYFVRIDGMFHGDFSDARLFSPLASRIGLAGPIDGLQARKIVNAYSLAFFDRHLKDLPVALLDGPAEQYPEVFLETRLGSKQVESDHEKSSA